jgi:hypothetical protein
VLQSVPATGMLETEGQVVQNVFERTDYLITGYPITFT